MEQLEAKFQDKKRSISESSQSFAHKLKKVKLLEKCFQLICFNLQFVSVSVQVCEEMPTMDESKFDEMVEKASVKLLQSYEEYKQKQREAVVVQGKNCLKYLVKVKYFVRPFRKSRTTKNST